MAQKGVPEPFTCLVVPFADRAAIFTDRSGRGVLAEAAETCSLWVVYFITGKEAVSALIRVT